MEGGFEWSAVRMQILLVTCNATRALIANLPISAQLGKLGPSYHSDKLYPGPCCSLGMRPQTDKQTHTQMRITKIHFA